MKENLIRFVICTSTLAQGVNLPIRYLIVTGVYQGADRIMVRDFHNLIGRAGRAGMHTEGSVIFAQTEVFDRRRDRFERWRWDAAKELLNPANSEPSASSLLLLFQPFAYGRPARYVFLDLAGAHRLVFDERAEIETLVAQALADHQAAGRRELERYFSARARIIQTVASFLLAHLDFSSETLSDDAALLCANTLAHHLADDDDRVALKLLFQNIATYVAAQAPTDELRLSIRRSALSPTAVRALSDWLAANLAGLNAAAAAGVLFEAIVDQVLAHASSDAILSLSDVQAAGDLALLWMQGQPFSALLVSLRLRDVRVGGRRITPRVENVIEICESGFGYDGAMLVGTMADLVEPLDNDLSAALAALHKRLKYGLPSEAAIAFYELGFADRVVSIALAEAFAGVGDRAMALFVLRRERARAAELLDTFPSYFEAVLAELLGP